MPDEPNVKLCECGCGQPAEIASKNRSGLGWVKGQPRPFARGHSRNGRGPAVEPPNPSGLCMCGCGQPTPIARQTSRKEGHVRGEPVRFVYGHQFRARTGGRNQLWRGDDASYSALHKWLASNFPKTGFCDGCGKKSKTEHAFLHHPAPHSRNRGDYAELCTSCHRRLDLARVRDAEQPLKS